LKWRGYRISHTRVRELLRGAGYRLRLNRKRLHPRHEPERNQQMRYLVHLRRSFLRAGKPVISVDTKKRELIGNFKNAGRTWRQTARAVLENDFPSEAEGCAIPYGIYDLRHQQGFVVVGVSHQTAAFAVQAIRRWWLSLGRALYPDQSELLIEADCGGANGHTNWLWKWCLQQFADEFGLTITVTHLPTGASKWNPIEHKLFCHISRNWAGEPLGSYETVLKFIRTTKTDSGLQCRAYLDKADYPTGIKLSAQQKRQINLMPRRVLPKWNYTIKPRKRH